MCVFYWLLAVDETNGVGYLCVYSMYWLRLVRKVFAIICPGYPCLLIILTVPGDRPAQNDDLQYLLVETTAAFLQVWAQKVVCVNMYISSKANLNVLEQFSANNYSVWKYKKIKTFLIKSEVMLYRQLVTNELSYPITSMKL